MRHLTCFALLMTLVGGMAAQTGAPGLPPLIDRDLLFGNPEIAGAQISPDGQYIAFLKPWNDTRNIWVKKTSEPFSSARLLTGETKRPIPFYLWTRDSKYIAYVKDNDGDENFNVYAIDPAAPAATGANIPASRDLTGLKGVRIALYSAPKNDPDVLFIGLNDRDKSWHDLYKLKISTGDRTLVRKNTEKIAGWFFDLQGQLRMASRTTGSGDQEILRTDADGFKQVYSCGIFENCSLVRFQKDGKRVYLETNKGDAANLTALVLLDPESGKTEIVESDPQQRVDFGDAIFSELTDDLVMTSYEDDRERRYFKDQKLAADYKWLESKIPGKEIHLASNTRDEQLYLVNANGDTEPGITYLFDRKQHKLTEQYQIREKLPRQALSEMKAIRYQSSDGLEIPAYLTLPKGFSSKSLPVLVLPHGGPWARDSWGYNPWAQFFANRGYAVLMPNFRGSTGYGKKFLNAGNGEWGHKMQDDLTWGVKNLIAQGVADPKRVGILGGSYGGYATLAGVAFTPDLYRAAVDIVGPANLITLLDAIPPYWEAGRKIMYGRMADPNTAAGKAWLKERSPLTSATAIKTPLMVVQGANDPRVNRAEAEQIVIALRDRGFQVEYILAPDEGHGFARPINNLAMFMAIEKFLAKQLDGRYQEGGTPATIARLKEITVDPKAVVLSRKVEGSQVKVPQVTGKLQPGTYKYQIDLPMGGKNIAMKASEVIQEQNGAWEVTDTVETPMGSMLETAVFDHDTLVVRKRSTKQGSMTAQIEYSDSKATGTLKIDQKETPINSDLSGPVFADAAGAQQAIAQLPLAPGYTATFRNFDLQSQKEKLLQLKVTGMESITVPAGSFESYIVEITSASGGNDRETFWIAKEDRKTVKMNVTLPQANGAVMVWELLP